METTIATGLHLRGPLPQDQPYIASTFVSSLGLVDSPRSPWERGQLVDRLLDKAGVKVAIAAELDGGKIIGWTCYSAMPSAFVHHYSYVRNQERRKGVGSALAIHTGLAAASHVVWTIAGPAEVWLRSKYPHASHLKLEDFLS